MHVAVDYCAPAISAPHAPAGASAFVFVLAWLPAQFGQHIVNVAFQHRQYPFFRINRSVSQVIVMGMTAFAAPDMHLRSLAPMAGMSGSREGGAIRARLF